MPSSISKTEEQSFFQPDTVPDSFKKAVGVVQVAMGNLGLLHRKCFNVAVANAYEGLGEGKRTFRVNASVVADWCDFNSNNYQALYDVFEELRSTPVKSITFDKKEAQKGRKKKRISGDGLLAGFAIIEGGIIEYTFTDHMAEILHEPEQYIWLSLHAQNKFDSKYEINLFENCLRYVRIGSTGMKTVDEWRGVLGASEEYYDDFKRFNEKVIKKASKNISGKSGILLEPRYEREKRRVVRLGFDVEEDPQLQLFEAKNHKESRNTDAYEKMRQIGLTDVEAIFWLEKKGEQSVLETITYVEGRKAAKNPVGYLISALRDGYGEKTPDERKKANEAQKLALKRKSDRAVAAQIEADQKALEDRHREHRHARTQELLVTLSPEDLADVVKAVSSDIPLRPAATAWDKIERNPSRVGELGRSHFAIIGVRLAEVVLGRWGDPADTDIEAFKQAELETA